MATKWSILVDGPFWARADGNESLAPWQQLVAQEMFDRSPQAFCGAFGQCSFLEEVVLPEPRSMGR